MVPMEFDMAHHDPSLAAAFQKALKPAVSGLPALEEKSISRAQLIRNKNAKGKVVLSVRVSQEFRDDVAGYAVAMGMTLTEAVITLISTSLYGDADDSSE